MYLSNSNTQSKYPFLLTVLYTLQLILFITLILLLGVILSIPWRILTNGFILAMITRLSFEKEFRGHTGDERKTNYTRHTGTGTGRWTLVEPPRTTTRTVNELC